MRLGLSGILLRYSLRNFEPCKPDVVPVDEDMEWKS